MLADLMAVSRTIEKSSQDQHVKGALKKVRAFRFLFSHRRHSTIRKYNGRHSTISGQIVTFRTVHSETSSSHRSETGTLSNKVPVSKWLPSLLRCNASVLLDNDEPGDGGSSVAGTPA